MQAAAHPDSGARRAALAIAFGGALLAVAVAAALGGRVHPDEIFQFLEPAHFVAFGQRVVAWEWHQGLRNWAFPGLLGGWLRLWAALGVTNPRTLALLVFSLCAGFQALGTLSLYAWVSERDGAKAGLVAAATFAAWGGWLVYAGRPLSDAVTIAPLLAALWRTGRARQSGKLRDGSWVGLLLGLAFLVRYPSAVFAVPIGISLLLGRRWRALAGTAVGGALVLAFLGALDFATWGAPFHSLVRFVDFNLFSGAAATHFGSAPLSKFLPILASMLPVVLLWHFGRGLRRLELAAGTFAFYLAFVLVTPHKEARFLVPLMPLFAAIAARPLTSDLARLRGRRWALALAVALFATNSAAAATVLRPFGMHRGIVDATIACGREPDFSGAIIAGTPWWGTAGRFYLHRRGPALVTAGLSAAAIARALTDPVYSDALVTGTAISARQLAAAGFVPIHRFGRVKWWHRRSDPGAAL